MHPIDVAPGDPNHAYTDQFDHVFTYALYPHRGDLVEGGVVQAGYELNVPLRVMPLGLHTGETPVNTSFVSVDVPNVIIEAVKKAEDDDGIILRLYEAAQRSAVATLRFGIPVQSATVVNLMETLIAPVPVQADTLTLHFRPFEIMSIKINL